MPWSRAMRNELFDAVKAGSLDPMDCDLEVKADETLVISYLAFRVPAAFVIRSHIERSFFVRGEVRSYELSRNPALRANGGKGWGWAGVTEQLTDWARRIHLAVTPDQWDQVALRRQLVARADAGENTLFTEAERVEIAAQLKALRNELGEQGKLTEDIKAALDEAEKASNRLGRKDWKAWLLGTVTGLVIAGTVDREVGNHVVI